MALLVKKFGGTSVGDIKKIKNIATAIKTFIEKPKYRSFMKNLKNKYKNYFYYKSFL